MLENGYDSILLWENAGQRKPVFAHILRSAQKKKRKRNNHTIKSSPNQQYMHYQRFNNCSNGKTELVLKKVFLKITQYSQENTSVGITFLIKLQA